MGWCCNRFPTQTVLTTSGHRMKFGGGHAAGLVCFQATKIGRGSMKLRFFARLSMFAVLICMSLLCAVGARAQETGDIVGTVTDSTGAVVPNATVTLTNTGTNVSQTAQSGGDGNYAFTLLQVGNYIVKVSAAGFKTATAPALALSSG